MAKTNTLKAASINIQKGGTGKSTTTYNLAERTAQNYSVLLIDLDKSGNLTDRYSNYHNGNIKPENKISYLFMGKEVVPLRIHDNLNLLAGGSELAEIERMIQSKPNNRMIMLSWIINNYDELNNKYDYIYIDTHNDAGLLTQNSWVVSDVVLGVSDPSADGFEALLQLEKDIDTLRKELVEVRTGESYVVAEYYFIGNKIKHNTNSSREFVDVIKNEKNYLGFIADKELINIGNLEKIPLIEYANNKKILAENAKFFENTWNVFDKVLDKINGGITNDKK